MPLPTCDRDENNEEKHYHEMAANQATTSAPMARGGENRVAYGGWSPAIIEPSCLLMMSCRALSLLLFIGLKNRRAA